MRIDYPDESQLPQLQQLWRDAFGDEEAYISCFFSTAFAPDRCRCVTVDGQLAASLYWLDCRCREMPVAYLYAVATAKKFRKRGICRALMENTHSLLRELGYAGAILVPGEPSLFAMYASMGYETFGGIREFTCRAEDPMAVRELTKEEYAALRRQRLPQGGVVQEGENLAFLSRLVKFYAGENCLFCAGVNENRLFCLELLGDDGAAPGIVSALGGESGTFRSPGEDRFAMYYPLRDTPAPDYFAFSFD